MELTLPAGHPLFDGVGEAQWAAAMERSDLLTVAKGSAVYSPGRFRRCLGVVLRGRLEVRRESILMATLSTGDVFGAAALFHDSPDYPTTLTALSPCRALLIPQDSVRRLLRECPAFAENYAAYLSGRIQFLSQRLETVSAPSAQGRLSRYLLSVGENELTLSATELCQRLGVGRASLYRAFEALEGAGAIAREGKTIRILHQEALKDAADENRKDFEP